jgi:hypothetical protein
MVLKFSLVGKPIMKKGNIKIKVRQKLRKLTKLQKYFFLFFGERQETGIHSDKKSDP